MWVTFGHLRPSGHIMPDHAGDRGAELLVLAPHDHLYINHDRLTSPARPASEPEAGQAARLRRQDHDRRAWLNAIHVPRRWSLRRCVERGSDARPAVVGFGRPTAVRPRLRNTRHRARPGHSRSVTLDYDVRVADRHRDRTPP